MPIYFFNVTGSLVKPDRSGYELADEDAAWSTAIVSMGDLLRDVDGAKHDSIKTVTNVTDAFGRPLMTLSVQSHTLMVRV
ncbi:hypothetical protein U0C82_13480 [Fulvimarina sp. 2208YS6-2-32]|uniref:DUF6894 domain-containing protein n=1 Tax=Fulvimarina uroteuthidis TaxID=3098149 RepID=A0ABU5I469_9HYPH|nr:hypothetical protein [Fulvimarina sp. 2208YS6-2-32]MDY8110152.1 hypothetical protein [Fulvimarina sp. 2208YS6-2-32]